MNSMFAAAAVALLAVASSANAASYTFSFTSDAGVGSGSFTTADALPNTQSLITNLTGTLGGKAITLLAPDTYPSPSPVAYSNDNLFTAAFPYFTINGLSFSAGGSSYNLYSQGAAVEFCGVTDVCNVIEVPNFTVAAASAVPEPATWGLMLMGFGALGYVMRRRQAGRLVAV